MRAPLERIDRISLSGLLPRVFVGEQIPPSGVWKTECTFSRPGIYLVEARSGGGKSSMLSFIYGARVDFEGEVMFNGRSTAGLPPDTWQEYRRRHLAYLPQELMLFPELSALENIALKNNLTGAVPEERIEEWMRMLGLGERIHWPAARLSVGQMQRVALIRALCQPFDFLLLDEPVSHLDQANNRLAAKIILEEAARRQAGIIATSVGNPIELPYSEIISL